MTRRIEPGDYTLLLHVTRVAELLAVAYDEPPAQNARVARDLVLLGACDGTTRADLIASTSDDVRRAEGHRRAAMRALASYLAVLEAAATAGGES